LTVYGGQEVVCKSPPHLLKEEICSISNRNQAFSAKEATPCHSFPGSWSMSQGRIYIWGVFIKSSLTPLSIQIFEGLTMTLYSPVFGGDYLKMLLKRLLTPFLTSSTIAFLVSSWAALPTSLTSSVTTSFAALPDPGSCGDGGAVY
jgi:hypothetical protein